METQNRENISSNETIRDYKPTTWLSWLDGMADLITKHGIFKLFLALFAIIVISYVGYLSFNPEKVIDKYINIQQEKHDRLTDYRISINSDINNILKDLCHEVDGTRAYILEFHNGSNNPSGLPFYYMDMTYEWCDLDRTYSGAASWANLLLSRYSLVSEYFNEGIFVGSVDDIMKVDTNLAYKLMADDVKYIGCILLYGKTKPIGILGVSTGLEPESNYHKVENALVKYSQRAAQKLDVESINLK